MLERRLEGSVGPEEAHKGGIGDWKLLKQMEMEERGKDKAVAARAKGKVKRVAATRRSTCRTVSASGTAQKAKVCCALILTTSRKFANQAKGYHSCS